MGKRDRGRENVSKVKEEWSGEERNLGKSSA
jgi:hypothetical protein